MLVISIFSFSFVVFFSFKYFSLSGIKSGDCLGEEPDVEKRNKTMHWLSLM